MKKVEFKAEYVQPKVVVVNVEFGKLMQQASGSEEMEEL